MEYKIIKATAERGQIEVLYSEGGKMYGVYAIDVPIVDGAFLTGQALHDEIMHRAPLWAIEREQALMSATGFSDIVALVQPVVPAEDPRDKGLADMGAQLAYEQKLAEALVKFGVLESNPTMIPVGILGE